MMICPSEAALRYARRGLPIFPCRGKVPLTSRGFKDATTDRSQIEAWWKEHPDALISVATGRISGVVVLDIDVTGSGKNGFDSLEELGELIPDTPIAHTPSGGVHCFFNPGDCEIPLSVGKIGAQLDVRGERSCCTLPTPGTAYRWDPHKNLKTTSLALAPAWLTAPFPTIRDAPMPAVRPPAGELSPYGAAAINSAVRCIFNAQDGQQSTTLNAEAYGLGRLAGGGVIPERLALDALMQGAFAMPAYDRRRPWRRGDLERSVRASFLAGTREPRYAER